MSSAARGTSVIRKLVEHGAAALQPRIVNGRWCQPLVSRRRAADARKRALVEGTYGNGAVSEAAGEHQWWWLICQQQNSCCVLCLRLLRLLPAARLGSAVFKEVAASSSRSQACQFHVFDSMNAIIA
jgi:hypothetical protein